MSHSIGTSTQSLHADDVLNVVSDVAPPMHLSTTFRYSNDPAALVPVADVDTVCPAPLILTERYNAHLCVVQPRFNLPRLLPSLRPKSNPLRDNPHFPAKRRRNQLLLRPLRAPCSTRPSQPTPHLNRRRLPRLPRRHRPLHPSNRPPKTRPRLQPGRPPSRRRDPPRNTGQP